MNIVQFLTGVVIFLGLSLFAAALWLRNLADKPRARHRADDLPAADMTSHATFLLGQALTLLEIHNPSAADRIYACVREEDRPGVDRGRRTPPDAPMQRPLVKVAVTSLRGES